MKNAPVLRQNRKYGISGQTGTSLLEVLLACSLTVILLTAAYSVAIGAISSYNTTVARSDAQSAAQEATIKLERDIRQAEKPLLYYSSSPGAYENLAFKADLNDDGTSEAILLEFHIYTKLITRKVDTTGAGNFSGKPVEVIAEGAANSTSEPVFSYYGTDPDTPFVLTGVGAEIDVINKTRNIRIRVVIDKDASKPPDRVESNTDIKLRNFAYGATR